VLGLWELRLVGDGDRERCEGLTLLFGVSGEYDLSLRAIIKSRGREWKFKVACVTCPISSYVVTRHGIRTMASDLLDPSALTALLPNLLPHNRKKLESPQDAVTALVHTAFNVLSFRLVAVDDSTPASNSLEGVLPDSWNSHGPGSYTLRYRHEQSSLEFVVKVVKLGSRTLINGIAVEVRNCFLSLAVQRLMLNIE
jgi:hypothetical protein